MKYDMYPSLTIDKRPCIKHWRRLPFTKWPKLIPWQTCPHHKKYEMLLFFEWLRRLICCLDIKIGDFFLMQQINVCNN